MNVISCLLKINKDKPSFLIVSLRFLGDVLVTTPLAVSLKRAYPESEIDYVVFEGNESVLNHNPLIRTIITVPHKRSNLSVLAKLFRKYDVAFGAYPSDRTAIVTAFAGKQSVGLSYHRRNEWWKKILLNADLFCDDRNHVVTNMLSLLKPFNVVPIPRVEVGCDGSDFEFANKTMPSKPYIIFHPFSSNLYKYLPAKTWADLSTMIHKHTNYQVVITKTPTPHDEVYLEDILRQAAGTASTFEKPCSLSQLAAIIKGASAYVGIDTVVTHMAAALGTYTYALYGPTFTRYWAPWPNDCIETSPFSDNKAVQHKSNVTVIQKDWECVPCNGMTCNITENNKMECLEKIMPEEILQELLKHLNNKTETA